MFVRRWAHVIVVVARHLPRLAGAGLRAVLALLAGAVLLVDLAAALGVGLEAG